MHFQLASIKCRILSSTIRLLHLVPLSAPLSNNLLALSNLSTLPLNIPPMPSPLLPSPSSILLPSPSPFEPPSSACPLPALLYISVFTLSSPSLLFLFVNGTGCGFDRFDPPNIFFQKLCVIYGGVDAGPAGTQSKTSCRQTSMLVGDFGLGGAILLLYFKPLFVKGGV